MCGAREPRGGGPTSRQAEGPRTTPHRCLDKGGRCSSPDSALRRGEVERATRPPFRDPSRWCWCVVLVVLATIGVVVAFLAFAMGAGW